MFQNKKGFTLIELLVVVIIIAILAAIALPKYQVLVEKTHAVEAYTKMKAIADSAERYALTTGGTYPGADGWDKLDIELAEGCSSGSNCYGRNYTLLLEESYIVMLRVPSGSGKYYLRYDFKNHPSSGSNAGKYRCHVYMNGEDPDFYKKVCNSLCGTQATGTAWCYMN